MKRDENEYGMNQEYVKQIEEDFCRKLENDKDAEEFLTKLGIDVNKPFEQILDQIYRKWNSLNRNGKNFLAEKIVGTHFYGMFDKLMRNYEKHEDKSQMEDPTKDLVSGDDNLTDKEVCSANVAEVTRLVSNVVIAIRDVYEALARCNDIYELQCMCRTDINDEVKEIKQERTWIINQMYETANSLSFLVDRLTRKLQDNIEKENVVLAK